MNATPYSLEIRSLGGTWFTVRRYSQYEKAFDAAKSIYNNLGLRAHVVNNHTGVTIWDSASPDEQVL